MSSYERRVAGKRLKRIDGVGKVTGKHVYAADFALPGMLLRQGPAQQRAACPHRADRRQQGAGAARRAHRPDGEDIPQILFGTAIKDRPVFAADVVRFRGQPIAAVAATSLEIAEAAVRGDRDRVRAAARGVRSWRRR